MRMKYALACFLFILIKGTISQTQTGARVVSRDRDIAIRSRISNPGISRLVSRLSAPGRQRLRSMLPALRQRSLLASRQIPRRSSINTQISPRTGSRVGITRPIPRTGISGPLVRRPISRSPQSSANINSNNIIPLSPLPCDRSRVVVCRQVLMSRMTCLNRGCRSPSCIVRCVCVCVSRSLRLNPGSRVFATRRVTPPNRAPIRVRNNLQIRPNTRPSVLPNVRPRVRQRMSPMRNVTQRSDLSFGLSESALASILGNPDVSSLVGPQGLNDILAGEPPPLITRSDSNQTIARGLGEPRPSPNGIPIPLSAPRLNPDPGPMGPGPSDMMLAGLMASDFIEIPELPMRTNIPAVNDSRAGPQLSGSSLNTGLNSTTGIPTGQGSQTATGLSQFLDLMVQTAVPVAPGPMSPSPTKEECMAQRKELWCDPVGIWADTPGVSRWCILNCRASDCDTQRCACACIEEILFKQKYEQLRAP